ncbi:MAG: DNA-binding protein [Rickettsiaceae bacterium]|jgi:nucleoid DNA-binding protein|nr:DNA-binding protein [Rickettsiaceae bacterium]
MATKKTKSSAKAATPIRPVKEKLTKSALVGLLAERTELNRKQISLVLSELEGVMLGSVHPKGNGEFMLPGFFKVSLRKVPARKAGTLIRNPATGEMMKAAAKPASVRVKIRPLAKLKASAVS